ncbi:unnamed protein product [Alopecurus aequalis]
MALRTRWRWLELVDRSKPWQGLPVQIPPEAKALFLMATRCEVGNGQSLRFWRDRWLDGCSVEQIAPALLKMVKPADRSMRVAEALRDHRWIASIRGTPSVPAIVEFLGLWEALRLRMITETREDRVSWRLAPTGRYSSRSAYGAFFFGREFAPAASELWSAGAPLLHKLHMWFVLKDRLWTADRLSRRGMDQPPCCALCCQEEETASHITLQCSFSRQVWHDVLTPYSLQHLTPEVDASLQAWWPSISNATPKTLGKEVNSLIILVARSLWLERNSRVFDKVATMARECLQRILAEFELWRSAGLCGVLRDLS